MLPSQPRSRFSKFSQQNSSLKTIAVSQHINKNHLTSEFDSKSFISLPRKPSRTTSLPEKRIVRVSVRQQHMGQLEEELKKTKDQLTAAEEERDQALDELKEMKKMAQEVNMKLSEAMPSRKVSEVYTELNTVKELLSNSTQELKMKEKIIESLKRELEKAKQVELRLAEKDASFVKLEDELKIVKISEVHASESLSENRKRLQELEDELQKGKESETKMFDSLVSQTKLLEQTKISLEESKFEIASLRQKVENYEGSSGNFLLKEAIGSLNSELQLSKQNLARAQESEKLASSKAQSVLGEMELLKNELKFATEAEETNKKAMDDLALALTEVATESNQAKEKLISTQAELERTKEEAEQLKLMLNSTEDMFKGLLDEAKKEADCLKNTAERLRLEAEDSLLAWNGKEMGFVGCIKRVEEDRTATQQENKRLLSSLLMAEKMTTVAKEENHKLRDILKQALNEANVAKEAAGIARAENSQLKDRIVEKDNVLDLLTQEVENLRINKAQAQESIKELNRMLSSASANDLKSMDKEQGGKSKNQNSLVKEHQDRKKMGKAFSFDLNELRIPLTKQKDVKEDPIKAQALKGSIFDITESPKSAPHHRRKTSSIFTDDGETIKSDDFDHLDEIDDTEHGSRKKRALLRRFSDLLKRRSFHRKEEGV